MICADLKVLFLKLGFKSRQAFYNVCLDLDDSLSVDSLILFWETNVFNKEVYYKIETVLQLLKQE